MSKYNLVQKSNLKRDLIFKISTDVENFHKVMPEYFKSLKIILMILLIGFVVGLIGFGYIAYSS